MNWKVILFWMLFWFVISVLALVIFTSGCRIVQPVMDFIFLPSGGKIPTSTTPENTLIDAIKGTNWLVTLSVLGIAAGTFAFVNGSKVGIPVIISCCVALFMSLAIARFAMWMAVFGMIGAVAAVAISVIVKNKALKDVVGNIQEIKQEAEASGDSLLNRVKDVLSNQAASTKKIVASIKKTLS